MYTQNIHNTYTLPAPHYTPLPATRTCTSSNKKVCLSVEVPLDLGTVFLYVLGAVAGEPEGERIAVFCCVLGL